tara:strand:- start:473 stop:1087 length:615 start_codon:yes stop_codon:yes gene_type:complete
MKIHLNKDSLNKWFSDDGDNTHNLRHNLNKDSIVIDIGAYTGNWISQMLPKYKCKYYALEPVKQFYDVLYKRFENSKDVIPVMCGISTHKQKRKIDISNDGSSAFHNSNQGVQILLYNIEYFMEMYEIEKIDLVQINIEGMEYELLNHWVENGVLEKIKKLQIQFHQIDGFDFKQARHKIQNCLLNSGFKKYFDYPFVWEAWEK